METLQIYDYSEAILLIPRKYTDKEEESIRCYCSDSNYAVDFNLNANP